MRIEAYTQVQQLYETKGNRAKAQGGSAKGKASDKIQISSIGKDIQTAKSAVASAQDIRAERVAALKARIEDGSYQVSGDDFAERLLSRYEEIGSLN